MSSPTVFAHRSLEDETTPSLGTKTRENAAGDTVMAHSEESLYSVPATNPGAGAPVTQPSYPAYVYHNAAPANWASPLSYAAPSRASQQTPQHWAASSPLPTSSYSSQIPQIQPQAPAQDFRTSPLPPVYRKYWDNAIVQFMKEAGLMQALRGFESDMVILNPEWERTNIPVALENLVTALTVCAIPSSFMAFDRDITHLPRNSKVKKPSRTVLRKIW